MLRPGLDSENWPGREAIVGRAEGSVDGLQHPSADLSQLFKSIKARTRPCEEVATQLAAGQTRVLGIRRTYEIVASEPQSSGCRRRRKLDSQRIKKAFLSLACAASHNQRRNLDAITVSPLPNI